MNRLKSGRTPDRRHRRHLGSLAAALVALAAATAAGCRAAANANGSYPAVNRTDCLPDVALVDQSGSTVSLASLKGMPVLVDFVYTTCKGPCPLLTAKLGAVAARLGPRLGAEVKLLSITLDPEHDHPEQLRRYATARGAVRPGWLFLTGTPAQVDRVLQLYHLKREREADGSLTHMAMIFLLGRDGKQLRLYNGLTVRPDRVVADIERAPRRG